MDARTFAVVGGDRRNLALSKMLCGKGHTVRLFGFVNYERESPMQCKNLYEAIEDSDYIIGPIPCSHNGGALNAPFHNAPIYVEDLLRLIKPHQTFIAGFVKPEIFEMASKFGIHILDMLKREDLLLLNAIPTAEGAIKIAIEETEITLHNSHMLVVGYGRVGKVLSGMLRGIGARVTAVVNKSSAAAAARCCGHEPVFFEEMEACLKHADIIFNTVPHTLLDKTNMKHIRKDTLLIDLSSPPYGVDVNDSRDFGLKVLYTNSLPGKIAPVTTAAYILDTVSHMVDELEGGDRDES
ncbi:MAG: dipicolinate synthase subunit DpsA [Clostridiales bacterium]|jgi:dipicolinate synthase subunit A|nr:dipicolinate synthase subunit DpsA [Clostridiales bacterium]